MPRVFLTIDPRVLRVPAQRPQGADPAKLQRQIALHGRSMTGMPAIVVYRGVDGALVIYDGVTRATRAAKLNPGQSVPVEIAGDSKEQGLLLPTIGDLLP
jgi:hypothetical protein